MKKIILGAFFLSGLLVFPSLGNALEQTGIGEYREFGEVSMVIKLEQPEMMADLENAEVCMDSKRLSFKLVESQLPRKWQRFWTQSLSINASSEAMQQRSAELLDMLKVVSYELLPGDEVVFEETPSQPLVMRVNGVGVAVFESEGFFDFLLQALVGPVPPTSQLKSQLLANEIESKGDEYYNQLPMFTTARRDEIELLHVEGPLISRVANSGI